MPEITTKARYYAAFERGDFGNRTETFTDVARSREFPEGTLFAIRGTGIGFKTRYNLDSRDLEVHSRLLDENGILPRGSQHFSVMAPDHSIVWQGELMRTDRGLYAYYSRLKAPMKTALTEQPEHAYGLAAECLLSHLDPSSRDDLRELECDYPNHVIELSVYDRFVGVVPNRNTIFWEARLY
jgi:hypothetical protein